MVPHFVVRNQVWENQVTCLRHNQERTEPGLGCVLTIKAMGVKGMLLVCSVVFVLYVCGGVYMKARHKLLVSSSVVCLIF